MTDFINDDNQPYFIKKDIWQRSFKFALRVIKMTQELPNNSVSWILAKQIVRSSSSIPANIAEGSGGSSKKEFVRYIDISRKSALETYNWLLMIEETFDLNKKMTSLKQECHEIIKILSTIAIKSKK